MFTMLPLCCSRITGIAAWHENRQPLRFTWIILSKASSVTFSGLASLALLALMLGHNGGGTDEDAARALDEVARRGELGVQFRSDGSAPLAPRAEGFAGALAEVVVPVAEAARDGSWQRVKACRAEDCEWAFYDRSRNRSGVWCDMAVCGNRAKVRAYRQRGAGSEAG